MIRGKFNPRPDLSEVAKPKKIKRSRKEKPPKSARMEIKYPSTPNYLGAVICIGLLLFTLLICLLQVFK